MFGTQREHYFLCIARQHGVDAAPNSSQSLPTEQLLLNTGGVTESSSVDVEGISPFPRILGLPSAKKYLSGCVSVLDI